MNLHQYKLSLIWTGNSGTGTSGYTNYSRSHVIQADHKVQIHCSSDPAFWGDPTQYNPEEMLVASVASCHLLWYLHLCADAKVVVLDYTDQPTGILEINDRGSGAFREITLNPKVKVLEPVMIEQGIEMHKKAHSMCFISNSLNFPILHQVQVTSQNPRKNEN